jgi:hypothetical protein
MTTQGCVEFICLNRNLKYLKHFKMFTSGLKMNLNLILPLFVVIMEGNALQMSLKSIYANMGSSIKPLFHTIIDEMV